MRELGMRENRDSKMPDQPQEDAEKAMAVREDGMEGFLMAEMC